MESGQGRENNRDSETLRLPQKAYQKYTYRRPNAGPSGAHRRFHVKARTSTETVASTELKKATQS
jgi:hypothetical protein